MPNNPKIAVIGLGYVGLPLAIALARHFTVTGFDVNQNRIQELQNNHDHTHEVQTDDLRATLLQFTHDESQLIDHDVYIVTVPTPITPDNQPDLGCLEKASETIGKKLKQGAIVVYESTVYPGVTEEFCGKVLERVSGLQCGKDFFLGYSPERINPGDKQHTIDRITKVISGQNQNVVEVLNLIYGKVNNDNIFIAKNIKTAEAAKVIENTQRDINIAFINEVAAIMNKLKLSVHDVLEAANTKWNFLNFQPGLVGGHCIGVDPYYLAHCARQLDTEPQVILAGRNVNENMGRFIAEQIHMKLQEQPISPEQSRILMLGMTFKENIPDMRNTKTVSIIESLQAFGYSPDVHDPFANPHELESLTRAPVLNHLDNTKPYDCIIGAVPHHAYTTFTTDSLRRLVKPSGLVVDIKNMWKNIIPNDLRCWTL